MAKLCFLAWYTSPVDSFAGTCGMVDRPLVSHRRPLRSTADDAIHALEPGQETASWVREEGLASVTQAVFVDQTPMQGAGADVPFSDLIAQVSRMVGLDHDHERSAPKCMSKTLSSFRNPFGFRPVLGETPRPRLSPAVGLITARRGTTPSRSASGSASWA